jgi:hypothetical protein
MKRKLKQRWSIIPTKSTKSTITSPLSPQIIYLHELLSSFNVLSHMLQLTLNSCPLVCHCQWFAVLVNHKRFGWRFGIRCLRTSTYQTQRFTGVK